MAVDTALKRKSISGIPLLIPGVTPDATEPVAWRQAAAWSYSGIVPGVVVTVADEGRSITVQARIRSLTVEARARSITVPERIRSITVEARD